MVQCNGTTAAVFILGGGLYLSPFPFSPFFSSFFSFFLFFLSFSLFQFHLLLSHYYGLIAVNGFRTIRVAAVGSGDKC